MSIIRRIVSLLLITALVPIQAQDEVWDGVIPTIISFTSNREQVTLSELEAGAATVTFSWHTTGLGENLRLLLHKYIVTDWLAFNGDLSEPLPPTGTMTIPLEAPINFGLPTYRLGIYDAGGVRIAERSLTIPYAIPDSITPEIDVFLADMSEVAPETLTQPGIRIPIQWAISNRLPTSNLRFEQLLEDGTTRLVELPRGNLWIPSRGSGVLAPVPPQIEGNPIQLRMRVIDMVSGVAYDDAALTIATDGTTQAVEPPVSTSNSDPTPPDSEGEIISFSVTPLEVDRGDTVTIQWALQGTERVNLFIAYNLQRFPSGTTVYNDADQTTNFPASGTTTYTIPDLPLTSITLSPLWPADVEHGGITLTVRCPYAFFAVEEPDFLCPISEAQMVNAVYQPFERGFMIWHSDMIWVFTQQPSGEHLSGYTRVDEWAGEIIIYDEVPPEGLVMPTGGFGKAWVDNEIIRRDLGWATAPETGYTATLQATQTNYQTSKFYVTLPEGLNTVIASLTMGVLNWEFAS